MVFMITNLVMRVIIFALFWHNENIWEKKMQLRIGFFHPRWYIFLKNRPSFFQPYFK